MAMMGDGINNAPVLAHADVSMALGSGTGVTTETANIVLFRVDLIGVVSAVQLSRRTMLTIGHNLVWAFFYNVRLNLVAAGTL